ncbi:MAG: DUF1015 family protein [Phycisphaerales bacterium]
MRLAPFTALRASQHHVTAVSCPPADLLTAAAVVELANAKARSIVSVLRHPEVVGVVEGTRPSPASHLVSLIEGGSMIRETEPWLYAYRVSGHGLKATGIIGRLDEALPTTAAPEDPVGERVAMHPARIGATLELTRLVIETWAPLVPKLLLDLNERPLYHFLEKDTGLTHSVWSLRQPMPYVEYLAPLAWSLARTAHAGARHEPVLACVFGADEWGPGAGAHLRLRSGIIGLERDVDD